MAFRTRFQLEQQIDRARQLRAETQAAVVRQAWAAVTLALARALQLARRAATLIGAPARPGT